jgi:hypothetical protein
MKAIFLGLYFALSAVSFVACGHAAETPKATDIETAMRTRWEKPGSTSSPKTTFTANSIRIGSGAKANVQDKIDGVPPEAWVTIALVDFTVRSHYSTGIEAVRRVRECKVYKDQFDEWAVMISRARGEDKITSEPLK